MKNSLPLRAIYFDSKNGKYDLLLREKNYIIVSLFGGAKVGIIIELQNIF